MELRIEVDLDYHFKEATDVLLAIEVAQLPDQLLGEDLLSVAGSGPLRPIGICARPRARCSPPEGEQGSTGRADRIRAPGL